MMKKLINVVFCHFLYKTQYVNVEVLKDIDKCVICPNHSNVFDPTLIYPVIDNMYIMAKKEIFKNKIVAKLLKHYNTFPVDRTRIDPQSLMHSIKIFEEQDKARLVIFPEGKVIKDEEEIGKKARNGAVFIAATKQIPIIPVYITRRPKFFSKVKVIFGEPIYYVAEILKDKSKIKEKSRELIDTIYKLNV